MGIYYSTFLGIHSAPLRFFVGMLSNPRRICETIQVVPAGTGGGATESGPAVPAAGRRAGRLAHCLNVGRSGERGLKRKRRDGADAKKETLRSPLLTPRPRTVRGTSPYQHCSARERLGSGGQRKPHRTNIKPMRRRDGGRHKSKKITQKPYVLRLGDLADSLLSQKA